MNTSEKNGEPFVQVILGVPLLKPSICFIKSYGQALAEQIFDGVCLPECSLLPQARNVVIRQAYENHPNFTHILFVDDDMSWAPKAPIPLYQADKDVISALCVTRRPPCKIVASFDGTRLPDYINSRAVVECPYVGFAFTLVKREVLDATREDTPDGPIWFTTDRSHRSTFTEESLELKNSLSEGIKSGSITPDEAIKKAIAFGTTAHVGADLIGEDIAFCRRAALLGFKFHVHFGVHAGHAGEYIYEPVKDAEIAILGPNGEPTGKYTKLQICSEGEQ